MKKHILLPILLLAFTLVLAAAGAYLKYDLFPSLQLETKESVISLPFVLLADEQLSLRVSMRLEELQNPTEPTQEPTVPPTETEPPETDPPETEPPETEPPETEPPETEPTEPPYIQLDDSWFDDVLFIGESRVDGLKSMARLGKADYFSGTSLTVYGILAHQAADYRFGKQNLESLLYSKKYGKIIIHLGINECSYYPDEFGAQYQRVIERIRKAQPDAAIIIHAIMPVTRGYARDVRFLPENIATHNERLQALITGDNMYYIDSSEWCADEEGFLRDELTNDGCHPHGEGYGQWAQWIKEECGWLGIP